MCGICGFVGRDDARLLEAMNAAQAHRGPDGEGVETFPASAGAPPAGLGHRRLSIIDPGPRGAQPMSYSNGRYWITYNGELYNFKALRSELESDGFAFRTECDTEVLLAAYARDGEQMLERLNGIFAFAIWDTERQQLFLARDRLGVKPLYYAIHDGVFYFASEVKALLPGLPRPSLNLDALPAYLTFLWVPEPETMFAGVRKLPAGHSAVFSNGRLRVNRYWDVTLAAEDGVSSDEWEERLRDCVTASVERQMVSDVPLGAFMSGGLDSSAVVAMMRGAGDPVTAYGIGYSKEDLAHDIVPDDLRYARWLAGHWGVDFHERVLEPDVVDLLPKLVWHMDEPVADPAAISTYLICKAASERMKVVLSGMGGDELFAGYPRHLAMQLTRGADRVPVRLRSAVRVLAEERLGIGKPGRLRTPRRNLMQVLRGIDQPEVERYLTYSSYYRPWELTALLSPEVRSGLDGQDPFAEHRQIAARANGGTWLDRVLYVDQKTFLPCLNLAYTDKMSMAASTEVRVPLLDDELVQLASHIPANLKLRGRTRKRVFKRSMEGVVPDRIINRPKAGFGAPVRAWLSGPLKPMLDDLLSPATISARGLISPQEVARLRTAGEADRADTALQIWALLTLELWQQEFLDCENQPLALTS